MKRRNPTGTPGFITFETIPSALAPATGAEAVTGPVLSPRPSVPVTVANQTGRSVSGGLQLTSPPIALVGGTSREPIRQPAARHIPSGRQVDLGAFTRPPFIWADAQATFPPFNFLKKPLVDIVVAIFLTLMVIALLAAVPLSFLLLLLAW